MGQGGVRDIIGGFASQSVAPPDAAFDRVPFGGVTVGAGDDGEDVHAIRVGSPVVKDSYIAASGK